MVLFEHSEFDAMRVMETNELLTLAGCKNAYVNGCNSFSDFVEQLTPAKRKQALAMVELYKRFISKKDERKQIKSSVDIFNIMRPLVESLTIEEVWVLYLNQSNKVVAQKRLSVGGITETMADVRLILRYALQILSTNIVLVHNHPNGECRPSMQDLESHKRLENLFKFAGCTLIDNLIIGYDGIFSMTSNSMRRSFFKAGDFSDKLPKEDVQQQIDYHDFDMRESEYFDQQRYNDFFDEKNNSTKTDRK